MGHCKCMRGERKACLFWSCDERDVGLFSILWRTHQDIGEYSTGSEEEEYRCTSLDVDGRCVAWEGDISSREEVEWTRCELAAGDSWICDEYELPKTFIWNHPEYNYSFLWFVF